MELSSEQQNVLDAFQRGENIFITGPGGTGKTALIKRIHDIVKNSDRNIQICAMTGCAAVLLNCEGTKTVHSWAGIGLATGSIEDVAHKVINNYYKSKVWKKTDVLVVDEVSMMSKKLFELLNYIGKYTRREKLLPFGGIQLVFSGDFYQLPPVGSQDDPESMAFCFESPEWQETFTNTIALTKIFRQKDPSYCKVLNQIRVGKLSKSSYQKLIERVKPYRMECSQMESSETAPDSYTFQPTILMARRKDVEFINNRELEKLDSERCVFTLSRADDLPVPTSNNNTTIQRSQYETEWRYLENNIIADKSLVLKVGTQVMCIANIDMEGPYPIVNGSQGIVSSFVKGLPMVKFNDGQTRLIGEHTWASENCPKIGVKQIPLIHAWAITIHKAQGATLDLVELDAGNSIFECGQTYVALSRVKSLEGLYLKAFDPQKIKINRKVQQYYTSIS